jgi:protein TonB
MRLRILIALILALTIHSVLFITDFRLFSQHTNTIPATNVIQMSLSSAEKKLSESKNNKELKTEEQKKPSIQSLKDQKNEDSETSDNMESITVIHEAKPLSIANKPPTYPRIAQIRGYQGTVVLRVLVNKGGAVSKLNILKSSGYWILDKSALTTVKDWRFEPGTDGKNKIDMWVEQPIRFQLK